MDSSTASFMLRERPEVKATLERVVASSYFGVRAASNAGAATQLVVIEHS